MNVATLTATILQKLDEIKRWQFNFLVHLMPLMLSLRGRYNFTNFARWGELQESTYRSNFHRSFPWLDFNIELVKESLSKDLVIAFDPSFLPKSGKSTAGIGHYYSGCASRVLRGMEMCGFAAIDQNDKTALHLEAVQTLLAATDDGEKHDSDREGLIDYYIRIITKNKDKLQTLSKVLVVDAWFAKKRFIEAMLELGFVVYTKLRKDAFLRYLYTGPKKEGRGRPKTYDGRVAPYDLREDKAKVCAEAEDGSWKAFELEANVKAWKRNMRIVIVQHYGSENSIKRVQVLAASNTETDGAALLKGYQSRFQIELLFRDAKQFMGLTHCQARSEQKINFHLNASLTAVSLAKVAHCLKDQFKKDKPFSLPNIKTRYNSDFLLNRFIHAFGINPKDEKIYKIRQEILAIGAIEY